MTKLGMGSRLSFSKLKIQNYIFNLLKESLEDP